MSRGKQAKFKEVETFKNVFQWTTEKVNKDIKKLFKQYDYKILELACGKGEYTLGLSRMNPEYLVMGVDIQGERIWKGAKTAIAENIPNAFFLRSPIDLLNKYIPRKSIDEIWITFPDPFLRERQAKKRLTSKNFLKIYKKILKRNGVIHLKTDSKELYDFTLEMISENRMEVLEQIEDIYSKKRLKPELRIQTTFEKKHLSNGKKIYYICFQF